MLLKPSVTNIMKNTIEKNVDPGSLFMTSVIVIKAKPVPPEPWRIKKINQKTMPNRNSYIFIQFNLN